VDAAWGARTAACLSLAMLGSVHAAAAPTGHVDNRCPRLRAEQYEELDARLQLLLKPEVPKRALPAIVCDARRAWLEWEGQRYPLYGRASLVDEAVDVIELQLHEAERRREADPRRTEDAAVASGEPMLEPGRSAEPSALNASQPADPPARRAADARGGGVAIGVETEIGGKTMGVPVGPMFDFVGSAGPLLIGGREAFRFSSQETALMFMDFEASVGYGAPFHPDKLLGASARFGGEWMVAYPEGNAAQAVLVPVGGVGLRIARSFGFVSVWAGIDGRYRFAPLRLGTHEASRASASATVGLAFVDWSRK
jgi:hypothetical protein